MQSGAYWPWIALHFIQATTKQGGETSQLSSVLHGLWIFHFVRGELQTAHEVAQQFMRLAQGIQDPTLLLEAHRALGEILYFLGEFSSAREHVERSIALYKPQQHSPHTHRSHSLQSEDSALSP